MFRASKGVDYREISISDFERVSNGVEQDLVIVVSGYQPNKKASFLLRNCLTSIEENLGRPAEVWVVDLAWKPRKWTVTQSDFPEVNWLTFSGKVRFSEKPKWHETVANEVFRLPVPGQGAISNGLGIDMVLRLLEERTWPPELFLTLHMDTQVLSKTFFPALLSKMKNRVAVVGARTQLNQSKEHRIVHPLGGLWSYKVLRSLDTSFLPIRGFMDVGEMAVYCCVEKGYEIDGLENSYSSPDLAKRSNYTIPGFEKADLVFDLEGELAFVHLGRGVRKSFRVSNWAVTTIKKIREKFISRGTRG